MSLFISDAFAVVTTKIGGIMYQLNDDNTAFVVQGSYGGYSGDIVLPSTVDHLGVTYTVSRIEGSAFRRCTGLTSLTVPNTVTSIGENAFSHSPIIIACIIPFGNTTPLTFIRSAKNQWELLPLSTLTR